MEQGGLDVTRANGVLRLTITKPDSLNALDWRLFDAATTQVRQASDDPDVRVIVLTGAGRAFSSGAQLGDREEHPDGKIVTLDHGNALVEAIVSSPKPVVAAVNGLAAGIGATLALACDLVVARRSAYFLLAFVNIGLMPDGGATALVPAAIGRARASRMALLGERIPAEQALDWGLISHVVDDDEFDAELERLVGKLAGSATAALARTKAALTASTLALLRQSHEIERAGQLEMFETDDFAEGVQAFLDKRPAKFTGR